MWGASKVVGCGWAYCSEIVGNPDTTPPTIVANAYYFACNYGPQYVSETDPGFLVTVTLSHRRSVFYMIFQLEIPLPLSWIILFFSEATLWRWTLTYQGPPVQSVRVEPSGVTRDSVEVSTATCTRHSQKYPISHCGDNNSLLVSCMYVSCFTK